MTSSGVLGAVLLRLREKARMSQADVASRLPFTASRISRLESGELPLDAAEAGRIAEAVGTDEAKAFARFLTWEWQVLEPPAFEHPARNALWTAEQALQRLNALKDDPDLRNAFLKQVESVRGSLLHQAKFLYSTEHPVAFSGSPGVGKTTGICALTDELRDWGEERLNRQMALQTGSGRTTICEVHVRQGGEYAINIEPCSYDELRHHAADFCDYLVSKTRPEREPEGKEGSGISAEMERTIRNMTGLTITKTKRPDGTYGRQDPAARLVDAYEQKDQLVVEILGRLHSPKRTRTSIAYPPVSALPPMRWLAKTFAEVNFGRHPEFSVPRRIEVSVPGPVLGCHDLSIRLIDTRGIDEPSAPRRDLQAYLDEDRAVVVLCSRFEDAPSAAVQALIERAMDAGLRKAILSRSLLLILPKEGEENAVLSESTGEPVDDAGEGRQIRLEQVQTTTLSDLGVRHLPIEFMNVAQRADCHRVRNSIRSAVQRLRTAAADRIDRLAATVDELIKNKADEQARAVFREATKPLLTWLASNHQLSGESHRVDGALLQEIDGLRYASSLRASVNRRGDWHNFDYWHGLGFGARRGVVSRAKDQLTKLSGIVENVLATEDLSDSHGFLRYFESCVDESTKAFFINVQQLGETAFAETLREDDPYWRQCQSRWGGGSGYKNDIRHWTGSWFSDSEREARHQFIEAEVQRRWTQMVDALTERLEPPSPTEEAKTTP